MRTAIFFISVLAVSCQSLGWLGQENAVEEEAGSAPTSIVDHSKEKEAPVKEKEAPVARFEAKDPRRASTADLELKVARLWARVDELETQLLQQKERNKLLERGLMLGIVPDELKDKNDAVAESKLKLAHGAEAADSSAEKGGNPIVEGKEAPTAERPMKLAAKAPEPKNSDVDQYRQKLQKAQDLFNNANYGQAITVYNEIGAQFDDGLTEGSQHYWIGLSWFYLKEFKLAEASFQTFRDRYPHNPWVAHAGFYLAKIDQTRGFSQRALEQYQKILDEFPDRDLGEMAKMEIERMREKL